MDTQKIADLAAQIQKIRDEISQKLLSLPQNPRIKSVGQSGNCFTIKVSDLMGGPGNPHANWSASYHDFRTQYRALADLVQRGSPETIISRLKNALDRGSLIAGHQSRITLHPDVIDHVRRLL